MGIIKIAAWGVAFCILLVSTECLRNDELQKKVITLRCCAIDQPPYIFIRQGKATRGIALENFRRLTQELLLEQNVELKCADDVVQEYRNEGNASRSDFESAIDEMSRCSDKEKSCKCDILLSMFVINDQRFALVDLIPLHFTKFQLVTSAFNAKARGAAFDAFYFVRAFDWKVWCAIAGLLLLTMVTFATIFKYSRGAPRAFMRGAMAAVWSGLGHIEMRERNEDTESEVSSRGAFGFFAATIVAIVAGNCMNNFYGSALTSELLQVTHASVIQGIKDFKNCHVELDRLVVLRNAAPHTHVQRFVVNSSCNRRKEKQPHFVNSIRDGFRFVSERSRDEYYYFLQKDLVDYEVRENYCKRLVRVGKPFFTMSEGFVVAKDSPISSVLNKGVLLLRQKELLLEEMDVPDDCSIDGEFVRIELPAVKFLFLAASICLATIMAFTVSSDSMEKFWRKFVGRGST